MQPIHIPVIYAQSSSPIASLAIPLTTVSHVTKDTTPILQQIIHARFVLALVRFVLQQPTASTARTLIFS